MACALTIAGRGISCRDALGGIKNVWLGQWTDGIWAAASAGSISDSSAALSVYQMNVLKNTSSFTQTINATLENGTVFFTQSVSFSCGKLVAADNVEIQNIIKGRMAVMVEDNNGNRFVMGALRGCEVSGGSVQSGTALGDLSGFTIEVTAEEASPAPFGPIVDGSNLTFVEVA